MMKDRYISVDVFRGFTIALMIIVNSPGSWSNTFAPLLHADWHGITLELFKKDKNLAIKDLEKKILSSTTSY